MIRMDAENSLESDESIAKRVQEGDKEAFGSLVTRYESKIKRYGKKFLSDREDIADILQEIFIKAFINIKSFDISMKFSSWLYRIAHNEFVNEIIKRKRRPLSLISFDSDTFFPHPSAPEESDSDTSTDMIKESINKCMHDLNVKYLEPLVLHYFEEQGYQEIADILHIPVSTVGVRIKRGKDKLKEIYENKYGKYE